MLKKSLGAMLIELREKQNSNQHGVAEAVGCTQKHLGDIERDQATPDPDLLLRLYLELVPEPARNDSLLEHCIFRFAVEPAVKEVEQKLRHLCFGDNELFRIFWRMAEDPLRIDLNDYQDLDVPMQELNELSEKVVEIFGRRTPSQYLAKFVGLEMVDPAAEVVALDRTEDNDFGIVSLGRNPYAENDDYVCIMAAGISALGTAQAVLSLARKSFDKHPFGGILEAITNDKPAPRDFEDAHSNWINREGYEPEKVVRNLEAALKQRSKDSSLNHLSLNEIEACLDFVRAMMGQTRNRK
jgi:transcriptional regulator with XRE-family HTH domain